MVSAVKMRRAQEQVLGEQAVLEATEELLGHLATHRSRLMPRIRFCTADP